MSSERNAEAPGGPSEGGEGEVARSDKVAPVTGDSAANTTSPSDVTVAVGEKTDPTIAARKGSDSASGVAADPAPAAPASSGRQLGQPQQPARFVPGFNNAAFFNSQAANRVQLSDEAKTAAQCSTCFQVLMLIGQVIAYAYALHLYTKYKDDSSFVCGHDLRMWLLVNGIYGVIMSAFLLLMIYVLISLIMNDGEMTEGVQALLPCIGIGSCCILLPIILLNLAWIILGSVWTYGMSSSDCNDEVYRFCYIYITCMWVSAGVQCLCNRRQNPYMAQLRG